MCIDMASLEDSDRKEEKELVKPETPEPVPDSCKPESKLSEADPQELETPEVKVMNLDHNCQLSLGDSRFPPGHLANTEKGQVW